jgi:catechol 2,3-dioxygenase-like lactoylglutathione lyase family enzyme
MNRRMFAIHGALAGAALLLSPAATAGDQIDHVMMFSIAVTDMPRAKAFYADKLGLKVTSDNRRDDHNWWVSLTPPDGGTTAHKELSLKGAKVDEVKNDLFGPGSGVKWFHVEDPDGNQVLLVQPRGKSR